MMVEHMNGHQCSARGKSTPRPSRITTTFVMYNQKGPEWIQKEGYESDALGCISTTNRSPVVWDQMACEGLAITAGSDGGGRRRQDAADEGEREGDRGWGHDGGMPRVWNGLPCTCGQKLVYTPGGTLKNQKLCDRLSYTSLIEQGKIF